MEEEEADDEEMGVAETYADYWPAKCNKINFFIHIHSSLIKIYFYSEIGKEAPRSSC